MPIFGLTEDQVTLPDEYAADLLGEVLDKYSLPDTRTTVLQDWMKGRRAEVDEVNGLVVEVLARAGQPAPYNAHTVAIARRIEAGELEKIPDNPRAAAGRLNRAPVGFEPTTPALQERCSGQLS